VETSTVSSALPSGSKVGRYFNLVRTASSAVLVLFVWALVGAGSFSSEPRLTRLVESVRDIDFVDIAAISLVSLVVGLALHPLQYALVQILEGYWGASRLGVEAMESFADSHYRRWHKLTVTRDKAELLAGDAEVALESLLDAASQIEERELRVLKRRRRRLLLLQEEVERLLSKYPEEPDRIMPTALGNRLRRAEDLAGRAWGLDSVTVLPYISLIADERLDRYLEDTVAELDLAVRFCIVWALATLIGFGLLWQYGVWLIVPAVTYMLALLSYRGAVVAAEEHGTAIACLIDLTRFDLYQRLGLIRPETTIVEREQNRRLMATLRGSNVETLRYAGSGTQ
jgi:hypothetical protein